MSAFPDMPALLRLVRDGIDFTRGVRTRFAYGALALAAACGDGTRRNDSEAQSAASWQVDSRALFDLTDAGASAEPLVGIAEGVTRLPNGDVLVADRGLYALRWFAPDGSLRQSIGRRGSGPLEFEYLARMRRCGNVVYVQDIARGATWQGFTLDGSPREGITLRSANDMEPYAFQCNASGHWIGMEWERFVDLKPGRGRNAVPFWIAAPDGRPLASLGNHPGSERLTYPEGSERHPLGKESLVAVGGNRAYIGTADSFVVQVYTLDGEPAGLLRDDAIDLKTTPADIERFWLLDTLGVPQRERSYFRKAGIPMDFPPTVPAYDAMLVDAEELVWVRRYPRRVGASAEWLVFRSDGTRVATVQLPEALTVHEIGTDYIAGIAVDPVDGRQSVRVYALRRGERGERGE